MPEDIGIVELINEQLDRQGFQAAGYLKVYHERFEIWAEVYFDGESLPSPAPRELGIRFGVLTYSDEDARALAGISVKFGDHTLGLSRHGNACGASFRSLPGNTDWRELKFRLLA
jgi:hypothetical protein